MVVRTQRHAAFFSGDTGLTTEYQVIRERLGPFDLVMLEVGAHHPAWGDMHLGPENALKAYALLGGGAFLPVQLGTFSLYAWGSAGGDLVSLASSSARNAGRCRGWGAGGTSAHPRDVIPWWRPVDNPQALVERSGITTLPETMPWPID